MEYSPNKFPTGRFFPSNEVEEGHKRGVLCLRCGRYINRQICDDCKFLQRCRKCSILCRPGGFYKSYSYNLIRPEKKFRQEFYQIIKAQCGILDKRVCESCRSHEKKGKKLSTFNALKN
jgi:hypothetical protein